MAMAALAEHGNVVLTGDAGVGKTRLAHEVLGRVARDGDRTEWVAATHSAATVPLGAVAHLVPLDALGRGRDSTLRAIVSAVKSERDGRRLIVGVDDAHLLDDASAALVALLARGGTASVVATLRSGETAPDAIVSLWKDGPAPLIALQRLSRSEVEALATTALGGAVEGATLHLLWKSSGGNALYLRELILHGIESGALDSAHGLWQWRGALGSGNRLHDLVSTRMGSVEDDERAALELLAVGQPLSIECLRELGVDEVATRLERRGLVTSSRRDRVEISLAHPLFGEVVRDRMPSTRRDEVQLQLADAVEATGDGSPAELFRIALWRVDAGDRSHPEQFRAAARRAMESWEPVVAERLARAALDSGPEIEASYVLGEALSEQNRGLEALEVLRAARQLPGPDLVRAAAVAAEAGVLSHQLGQLEEAELVLSETLQTVRDPAARSILEGGRAAMRISLGGAPATEVESLASAAPTAVLAAVLEHTAAGHLELAVQLASERLATASQWVASFPTIDLYLDLARVRALLLSGEIAEAEQHGEAAYDAAVSEGVDFPRGIWSFARGVTFLLRGLPRLAVPVLRETAAVFRNADRGFLRPTLAYLAMASALAGDVTAAAEDERAARAASASFDGLFGIDLARADAWLHAARGDLVAAARIASSAAETAAGQQQPAFEVLALHDVARFAPSRVVARRLEQLSQVVDGRLVRAIAVHARGLADDDGVLLDDAARAFASMTADLFGAEASFAAARVHRRSGRRGSAFASLERGREHAARCERARTHALRWTDQPEDLTPREQEIAALAAGNISSREIAERLGISTRTVDNLLGRVYAKLGISSRQELAALRAQE
jgi:DNA-binding CsgD family transcriptional regulator